MKILFFNYEYPPLGGGAANATAYLMKEFAKIDNLEIDVVTSSIDNEYKLEKIGQNIKIHRLPIGKNKANLHFQSRKDLLIYSWRAYFFARKLIKNNQYDLSHSFFSVPCGVLSLLFKKQYGLPFIVSLRGADVPGYSERFTRLYRFLVDIIKQVWRQADFVVANSQGLKDLALKTKADQKIEIIYNGVDTKEFFPDFENKKFTGTFEVLCISRLTPRKGLRYLIPAFAQLGSMFQDVKLLIVGEGEERKELEESLKNYYLDNRVEFMGLVPHENLPEIYRKASVFVLPSLNEGMSNTMLEAMASGLPIVATETGGTKELVIPGKNGFIVKQKDPDELADKLRKLCISRVLLAEMAYASRTLSEHLSWSNVAEAYLKLYRKYEK